MMPTPKFLQDDFNCANNKTRRMSQRQERRNASLTHGIKTIGSGNKGMKGDVYSHNLAGKNVKPKQYEDKITGKEQITIKKLFIDKVSKEAFVNGQEPVLVFGFEETQFAKQDWGAVPLDRLIQLFEIERQYYETIDKN